MSAGGPDRLELRRRIAASRDRIFRAWTEAEGLRRWLAPGEAVVVDSRSEAQVGGRWSVTMRGPAGEEWTVGGVFEELDRPERLVLTWRWSHEPEDATSRVTVVLEEVAGGTELSLVHEGLAADARAGHGEGWESCLDRLSAEMGEAGGRG